MSGPIQVDHATLHAAAADVRATQDEVGAALRRLSGVVDDLAPAWQGQAAAGFQELMQRWRSESQRLSSALGDIADLLDAAGTRHQVNDEEQSSVFRTFGSALG